MGYSKKHKMLILQKVLPPNSVPVHEASKDSGISVQTIYKWMQQVKNDKLAMDVPDETIPRFKTDVQKFSLLIESKTVTEADFGEWLRKNGIHSDHLILWEQELAQTMSGKKIDVDAVQKENKEQKSELKKSKEKMNSLKKH